jgi:L-glutamine-phosphate cytidylyltransferase
VKAIIIGAGRGRRLMPLTEETPKCYAEVGGRRILDWALAALRAAGLDEIIFVGGYQIELIRADYPELAFRHNADWERNNILASLFHAEDAMADGFVCSYADILYRPSIVRRLLAAPGEIVLAVDTDWRARYLGRSLHPEDDAEKVLVDGDRVMRLARDVDPAAAHGEYIGLARFGPAGAAALREHYHREADALRRSYLIELLQRMLERGVEVRKVDTAGDYFEVDTTEDYQLAQQTWR